MCATVKYEGPNYVVLDTKEYGRTVLIWQLISKENGIEYVLINHETIILEIVAEPLYHALTIECRSIEELYLKLIQVITQQHQ